jgi:hypothetical protein
MSKCRARGPSGLVEIDDALFGGNEHRERNDGLGDRCQSDRPSAVAVRRDRPTRIDDADCSERDRPVIDLAKCLHAARY